MVFVVNLSSPSLSQSLKINHPDLVAMRKRIVDDLRKSGATPDLVTDNLEQRIRDWDNQLSESKASRSWPSVIAPTS